MEVDGEEESRGEIKALVEWMHAHPDSHKFKHDKAAIAKVPYLGRGIIATDHIEVSISSFFFPSHFL